MSQRHFPRFIDDVLDEKRARGIFEIGESLVLTPRAIALSPRSDVFRGSLGHLDTIQVAVKYQRGPRESTEKVMTRIIREIFTWSRLDHPNIPPLLGLTYVNETYAVPGIITLFVEHELMDYVTAHPGKKKRLILEIGYGVQYLHSESVIHGDLKPENVRVSDEGQAKIIDFGMGKVDGVMGYSTMWDPNPRYFAPEMLTTESGIPRPTFESDIYSFAMLILRVLHGKDLDEKESFDLSVPFNDFLTNNPIYLIQLGQAIAGGRRPRRERYRNITQAQWDFLEKCWKQLPKERPQSMTLVLETLEELL